ncbi:MAG: glutamine--tRNA ligase/YqeY domain fusion protein [Armatimonadetes bacterium]|nr:glutamine--tRNA ligase/YqeY domain fusion protein [Armatimonadota bacterium]
MKGNWPSMTIEAPVAGNFIRDIIEEDNRTGKHGGRVATRFPPEPNGYLHIGHSKSIWINFGLAAAFGGTCNLRFDDTNPVKEDVEYVESIQHDIKWLGYRWHGEVKYASDYFDQLYEYAVQLIKLGKAYVESLSAEDMKAYRGTLTEPGKESPYRNRSVEENLDLFERMKNGEFPNGAHVLRARIDMASPNINMRDPTLYRIIHAHHHRTGDKWCIYPMYDFTHCLSDMLEGITHSICTLEFEDHRPLYDWCLETLQTPCHPQQIEFARLNLTYTVMSKRKFLRLVNDNHVRGWDDPRMPTLAGMRRRGYTPEAIRVLAEKVGVAKANSVVDFALLEHCVREDMNRRAARRMAVLRPLKLVITNYPEGQVEEFDAINNPEDTSAGTRKVPFSREVYIEQDDFREVPPPKYHRLYPGNEIRLKAAYYVKCTDVIKDAEGNVVEVHCTYDPETRGGTSSDGRKVRGTSHWVSVPHAKRAEVRLYSHLFTVPNPNEVPEGQDFIMHLNPNSLEVVENAALEPSLGNLMTGEFVQFERTGYFSVDPDRTPEKMVFNRTVTLKDSFKV